MSAQSDVNVHRFECSECGWLTVTPPGTDIGVVFHPCQASGRRERSKPTFIRDRAEHTQDWARTLLGPALADSIEARDPDALLRKVDEE